MSAVAEATGAPGRLVFTINHDDTEVNTRYYRRSTCNRYSVAKVLVAGKARYEAWRRLGDSTPAQFLGAEPDYHGATQVCQRHSDTNP